MEREHVIKDLAIAIEKADSLALDLLGLRNATAPRQAFLERHPNRRATTPAACGEN